MANALYVLAKQSLLGQNPSIDLDTDSIKVALVTAAYVANLATDQFLSSVGANRVGTDQSINSPTVAGGVFDGADVTFPSVSGSAVTQLVVYKDTGTPASSPLVARFDTGSGLPITPNGGNITVAWDNGAAKIFAL